MLSLFNELCNMIKLLVPPRALGNLKCVCKRWYELSKDDPTHSFISQGLSDSLTKSYTVKLSHIDGWVFEFLISKHGMPFSNAKRVAWFADGASELVYISLGSDDFFIQSGPISLVTLYKTLNKGHVKASCVSVFGQLLSLKRPVINEVTSLYDGLIGYLNHHT